MAEHVERAVETRQRLSEGAHALDGQPAQPQRKDEQEDLPEPKDGQRKAGEGHESGQMVGPRIRPPGGQEPEPDAHGEGDHERSHHEQERRRHAAQDERGHGFPIEEGGAEVAAQNLPEVDEKLHAERLVQPELRPDVGHVLRCGRVARQNVNGITRREVDQAEVEDDDEETDRQEPTQAREDVALHALPDSPHSSGGGSGMPSR